jgi:hypothetical protein
VQASFWLEQLDIFAPSEKLGLGSKQKQKTSWLVEVGRLSRVGKTTSDGPSQPYVYKH